MRQIKEEGETIKESITIIIMFIFAILGMLLNITGDIILLSLLTFLSIVLGRWIAGGLGVFLWVMMYVHLTLETGGAIYELTVLAIIGGLITVLVHLLKGLPARPLEF